MKNSNKSSLLLNLRFLNLPLISTTTAFPVDSLRLEPDRPYTIGRSKLSSDFTFNNRSISKQHCQILYDCDNKRVYIIDGVFLFSKFGYRVVVDQFRRRLLGFYDDEFCKVKVSLNGLFVNGVRVSKGEVKELIVGDEVSLVCGNEDMCGLRTLIGFSIQNIVFEEESDMCKGMPLLRVGVSSSGHSQGTASSGNRNKRVVACRVNDVMTSGCNVMKRAKYLHSWCEDILSNDDPLTYIRYLAGIGRGVEYSHGYMLNELPSLAGSKGKFPKLGKTKKRRGVSISGSRPPLCDRSAKVLEPCSHSLGSEKEAALVVTKNLESVQVPADNINSNDTSLLSNYSAKVNPSCFGGTIPSEMGADPYSPPGKKFYLNRLEVMDGCSGKHNVISLPELLHPIESISRIFIATFTSDILWFLSYAKIPCHIPVTIACHNTEKCWSLSPDKRTYMPYPDFPNLVVVHPPFPEAIAFGKDRKKQGIACHHPKLLVVQRDNSIRVVITSANLNAGQWNGVTNTIWWQDFPRATVPDYSSLFLQTSEGERNQDLISDFAAQLAGFMSSLLIDVPSQGYWIAELAKYDFTGAVGHLVASVPGIHSHRTLYVKADHLASMFCNNKFHGSVEASVVGLSHIFNKSDSNGVQLKKLAAFLRKSHKNTIGLLEVVLRRDSNVPADANAVSVLVSNPDEFSEGDFAQLGFLPRNIAKWLSPLWDIGFFKFSGYICPQEALEAALGENNKKFELMLHVFQGPHFPDISKMLQPEHAICLCSLIASIQRCTGLWRLQEVLGQYKWPDHQESDFMYGCSSIGSSVNAQFLAAFSVAAGKKSSQFCDSEESDPEWGCWSASQELRNPSVRIVFPTVERVKNSHNGIFSSKRILCFSEKTWERLRPVGILHDAVPQPDDRIGYPMHVKVARRRFQSRRDASPFGWVYCGSHNFSAAAWGRQISGSSQRLHVCNYELGIVFICPPSGTTGSSTHKNSPNLDDIVLPFVVPAPKYEPKDRPATKRAMWEALAELTEQERKKVAELEIADDVADDDDEEDVVEVMDYVVEEEKEDDKAYAQMLWSQVDSSQKSL
ncbi:hypothetical protein ACFE04_027928 [Oxalis oulophora]